MAQGRDYAAVAEQAIAANRPLLALEFHPAAIAALDAFIDLTWGEEGAAPDDDRWQPNAGKASAIVGLGAFFGELMRRQLGGEWRDDPARPDNPYTARVVLAGGHQVFAIGKVYKRLKNGVEDRLEPLYLYLRNQAGDLTSPAEAEGWLRQARHFKAVGRPDLVLRFCERGLACTPEPATRAAIEELRGGAASASRAEAEEERRRGLAESRAALAELAGEGRRRLGEFGVRVEHGALTVFGLDTFVDETIGKGPVAEAKRDAAVERALGAFLGELLCARFRGQWREQPRDALARSQVVWPSGLASCPFEILSRRLAKGSPSVLEQVTTLVGSLRAQGDMEEEPPEDPRDWLAQADAYAQKGRLELAVLLGKVSLGCRGGDAASSRLKLARWCRTLGRAADAKAHLDAGLRLEPQNAALARERLLHRAAELVAQGLHAPALEAFEQALLFDPASGEGLLGKARALLALDRIAECREWLDGFAGRSDCEPDRRDLAARAADAAGDRVLAHRLFENLKGDRSLPAARRAHAEARAGELAVDPTVRLAAIERLEPLEQAVAGYARFNADYPDLAEPWRERGVGLSMLGRIEEALECLRRAAALEPTEPKSYDHEGVILARLKRFDEAIAALDRGLRSCPGSGLLLSRKGIFLAMGGRNEEALRACEAALLADPEYADSWAFKGDIEQRLGRNTEAIASIERYLAARAGSREKRVEAARRQLWALRNPGKERDPGRAQACAARALQQVQARALPEALALYDEAVREDPLSDLAWVNRGTCLYEMSRFEEALASFARGEELGGPTSLVADAVADCLVRLRRGDEALRTYDALLDRQPGSPEGLRGKARMLVRLGRAAEAVPLLQRLLAGSPEDETLARQYAEARRGAEAQVG
jgi:tetratricopeptide (TPR) repeat protein